MPREENVEKRVHATRQRAAIDGVFEDAAGPLTAEEIWAGARRHFPRLSLRTVFRNLQERVETGGLSRVSFPGQSAAYEKPAPQHHPHFSCLGCRRIFSLKHETPDVRPLCKLPRGFKALGNEVTLFGYCASCGERRQRAKRDR
jgi:Fur family ferric uptake transcriptional regulator